MSRTSSNVPQPRPERVIDLSSLGKRTWVADVTYSPDGRFLGLMTTDMATTEIIIWDIEGDRLQTRIATQRDLGLSPHVHVQWSPDGQSIAVGNAAPGFPLQIWNPMTGATSHTLDVDRQCGRIRFNSSGSKFLVMTTLFAQPYNRQGFRIYDTVSWQFEDFDGEGLSIAAISWALDDFVLVAGSWPKRSEGLSFGELQPKMFDVLVRLIDPSGSHPTKTIMLATSALSGGRDGKILPTFSIDDPVPNPGGDRISLSASSIFDATTLQNWVFASDDDIRSGRIPSQARAFSPDGCYLYLKDAEQIGTRRVGGNAVIDAYSGEVVARFDGGNQGLAVRSDGRQIAIGGGYASVELLRVDQVHRSHIAS